MKMTSALLALLGGLLVSQGIARGAEQADALVEQARTFDRALHPARALPLYMKADALEPGRADIQIGISRQYRHLMADAESQKQKLKRLDTALDYADRAVKLAPKNPEAHLAVAITYAKRTPLQSSRENVETARLMKAEIDRVLALDPHDDTAWYLLGRWMTTYAELSAPRRAIGELLFGKLPAATHEQAAKCFERAVAENPDRLMHHIELGRAYAAVGRKADARRCIEKGLAMPSREKDDPAAKQRGRETLASLH
jgi:tetratricopeptide (TPR) repeat protein